MAAPWAAAISTDGGFQQARFRGQGSKPVALAGLAAARGSTGHSTATSSEQTQPASRGDARNNYRGQGDWTFSSFGDMFQFFRTVAVGDAVLDFLFFAAEQTQIERGCVGLCMLRLGQQNGNAKPNFPHEIPGAIISGNLGAAVQYRERKETEETTEYRVWAMQLPGNVTIRRNPPGLPALDHQILSYRQIVQRYCCE